MSLPIYDLAAQYAVLAELPLEAALDDQPANFDLDAELEALRDELRPKLLSLAKVVRTLESEAELLEEHGRALMGRAGTRRRRAEYLKRWLQLQMEGAGVEKLKDPLLTVWLQASPPSIDVVDETAVPPEYKRVSLKLPLSAVPPSLLGLVQTCDVDRALIHDLIKTTGELPPGIDYRCDHRHLRIH